jgi:N-hydroxyarylamine O-acetyltransferase
MRSQHGTAPDEWSIGELNLTAYLRRIGYYGGLSPTAATLARLHRAHVTSIPFENADITLGRGIAVDLPSVQDKLVHRRRGGYCYEHGLLLAAALERLGYRVERLLARVGDGSGPPRARTHLVLRVHTAEGCWLADTGFGSGLLDPLPFDGAPHTQDGWTYRLLAVSEHAWNLQEQQEDGWVTLYWLDDQPQHAADIVAANHFTATYPDSGFVRHLVVNAKDAFVLRRLTDRRLTVTRPGKPIDDHHLSDGEFAAALRDLFGLPLGGEEIKRLTEATAARSSSEDVRSQDLDRAVGVGLAVGDVEGQPEAAGPG